MIKQSLIIYNLPVLFNILNEIKENLKFDLYNIIESDKLSLVNKKDYGNYLILTDLKNKISNINNQLIIEDFPININSIVEKTNIGLLKQRFNDQSEIILGNYKVDINSREIFNKYKRLKLTEKEIDIILFLQSAKNNKTVENLQKEVWGHNSSLETHTVETHIYRLRKKINSTFKDENFIISTKNGYKIK
tara:strand:+ start:123 stop:695 length:573 start_codon:yes stop_codon:yes gene_type:complete